MKTETGDVIRQFRLLAGLSQDQLVDKIDMSKAFLSEIETGKKMPSLKTVFRLASAMGVKASDIVKLIEERLE